MKYIYIKDIRDYDVLREILDMAYREKNKKIAQYIASFSMEDKDDMELVKSLLLLTDKEFEDYIKQTFYEWKVIYNSYSSITVLGTYSGGKRWNKFLYSMMTDTNRGRIRIYYYRVHESIVLYEDLLETQYIFIKSE